MQTAVPSVPRERKPVSQRLTRTAATAASIVAILLGLAPSSFAVSESGDAGDLPATAQDAGSGGVPEILGSFPGGGDVDVYRCLLYTSPSPRDRS